MRKLCFAVSIYAVGTLAGGPLWPVVIPLMAVDKLRDLKEKA